MYFQGPFISIRIISPKGQWPCHLFIIILNAHIRLNSDGDGIRLRFRSEEGDISCQLGWNLYTTVTVMDVCIYIYYINIYIIYIYFCIYIYIYYVQHVKQTLSLHAKRSRGVWKRYTSAKPCVCLLFPALLQCKIGWVFQLFLFKGFLQCGAPEG